MLLTNLTWPEADKLDREVVIVSPIGAVEQHSRHLPFFTDTILCDAIAARVEQATPRDILLLPTQWLGASAHHLGMVGTLTATPETYLHMLCEPLRCLLQRGFKRAFILNGHGGNTDIFHLALRQLSVEFPQAIVAGASYWDVAQPEISALLEGTLKEVGHACEFETSLMLYLRPELVRVEEIADDALRPLPKALEEVFIPLDMKRQTGHGGHGQPTLASAKKGKTLLDAVVRKLNEAIEGVKAARTVPMPSKRSRQKKRVVQD